MLVVDFGISTVGTAAVPPITIGLFAVPAAAIDVTTPAFELSALAIQALPFHFIT